MKNLFLAVALAFAISVVNAQTVPAEQEAKPAARIETKQAVKATNVEKRTEVKVVRTEAKAQPKGDVKIQKSGSKAVQKTEKKVADGRTKTGDKVFHDKKGPSGETVYVGPRGGYYYLDKKENKVYIK